MSDKPRLVTPDGLPVNTEPLTHGTQFEMASDFNIQTGRSTVKMRIPGTDMAFGMLPAEARILGLQLICMAEQAIEQAVFLRAALEVFEMEPAHAIILCKKLQTGTRADHAMEFERSLKAQEQGQRMAGQGESNGSSETH